MSRATSIEKNVYTPKGQYCQQNNSLVPCLSTSGVLTAMTSYFLYHSKSTLMKYKLCSLFFLPWTLFTFLPLIFSHVFKGRTNFLPRVFFLLKVSERVERRLQEIEEEMRAEREFVERRQDQLGHVSLQLQEVCKWKLSLHLGFD